MRNGWCSGSRLTAVPSFICLGSLRQRRRHQQRRRHYRKPPGEMQFGQPRHVVAEFVGQLHLRHHIRIPPGRSLAFAAGDLVENAKIHSVTPRPGCVIRCSRVHTSLPPSVPGGGSVKGSPFASASRRRRFHACHNLWFSSLPSTLPCSMARRRIRFSHSDARTILITSMIGQVGRPRPGDCRPAICKHLLGG